jgi:hypothetical protein
MESSSFTETISLREAFPKSILVKTLKTKRNWLASIILFVLLVSLVSPLIALQTSASEDEGDDDVRIIPGNWYKLESDIVTVLFPAGGQKPMFIWWYTNEPNQVYVVKFQGLIEWLAIEHSSLPNPDYYNSLRNASAETWSERFDEWYFKPMEEQRMTNMQMRMMFVSIVQQMMEQMELSWHRPFLDFSAAQWSLSDIHNITASDGKIIGVAFAFTLIETPQPRFQFAENNIMLRIRFYNTTVQETVPGTGSSYTVNAGEMKMDLVINKWVWNLDSIKALVTKLQSEGFNINIPNMKSRLALWVNLASINITRISLTQAEDQPEGIEDHSTATVMEVDDHRESMGMTTEQEEPIETSRPIVRIQFANQTETLAGFFRFVAQAKVTNYPNQGDINMAPVKAAFRPGGAHMKLFLGYPYFGNGTLEHDPSIGVDDASVDTTPKYTVKAPSGSEVTPTVIGAYIAPLFNTQLMIALIIVVTAVTVTLYVAKWKRKTPVNMVGVGK